MAMTAWRPVIAVLLLVGGIGMLVYGARFRTITVLEQKTEEVRIAIPSPFDFGMPGGGMPGVDPSSAGAGDQAPGDQTAGDDGNPFEGRPAEPGEDSSQNPFAPPGPPGLPFAPPGLRFETVIKEYLEPRTEPEWAIVRDVTVGGVVRLANGELKRTYSGKPPALCPT